MGREERRVRREMRRRALQGDVGDFLDIELTDTEADREKTADEMAQFMDDFNDLYKQLVANVQSNLANELDPVWNELQTLQQVLDLPADDINSDPATVERAINTAYSRVKAGAGGATRLMRSIVQQCNEIINALGAV